MTSRFIPALLTLALAACAGEPYTATTPQPVPAETTVPAPTVSSPTTPEASPPDTRQAVSEPSVGNAAVQQPVAPLTPAPVASAADAAASVTSASSMHAKSTKPVAQETAQAQPSAQLKPGVVAKKPVDTSVSGASSSSTLRGHVDLIVGAGQSVDADEVTDAVVYFVPDAGAPRPKPGEFRIYTHNKQFDPTSLVIPVGSTVNFPNQDEIIHNVFSATPGSEFDLGLYGEGGSGSYTFKKPGLAIVNCNVHQAMQTTILVLDTPYFAHPSKDGEFRLTDVPAGSGKLTLWHPRAAMQSVRVTAPASAPVGLHLTVTKPRVIQHLNKERQQYQIDRL